MSTLGSVCKKVVESWVPTVGLGSDVEVLVLGALAPVSNVRPVDGRDVQVHTVDHYCKTVDR